MEISVSYSGAPELDARVALLLCNFVTNEKWMKKTKKKKKNYHRQTNNLLRNLCSGYTETQ